MRSNTSSKAAASCDEDIEVSGCGCGARVDILAGVALSLGGSATLPGEP